jgi:signal transduction histidine kinase
MERTIDKAFCQNLFSSLSEISSELLAGADLKDILELICRKAWEVFDAQTTGISLLNKKNELQVEATFLGEQVVQILPQIHPKNGIIYKAFETCRPILSNDWYSFYRKNPAMVKALQFFGISKGIFVPLKFEDKCIGTLSIARKTENKNFTQNDIELAQIFATQATLAITQAQLLENLHKKTKSLQEKQENIIVQRKELNRKNEHLLTLLHLSRYILKIPDLDKILQQICKRTALTLGAERCSILLVDDKKNGTVRGVYLSKGEAEPILGRKILWDQFGRIRQILKKRGFYLVPDTSDTILTASAKEYFARANIKSLVAVSLFSGKKVLAILTVGELSRFRNYTGEEIKFLQAISNQTALAIENLQLMEQAKNQAKNLKALSSQILEIQEKERKKIALDLHDEISQNLAAIRLNLESALKLLEKDPKESQKKLAQTEELTKENIQKTRDILMDLRPPLLDDFGLTPALRSYLEDFSQKTGIEVEFSSNRILKKIKSEFQTILFRIIQEGLTNVLKHAKAKKIDIDLGQKNSRIYLKIEDNGIGFDVEKVLGQFTPSFGMGILGIKERVKLLKGNFVIRSKIDKGTRIEINFPLT